ncbi:MAG: PAS domain-containing protein [bacterium]|nr:PAS domain-containing protein [bacterium]
MRMEAIVQDAIGALNGHRSAAAVLDDLPVALYLTDPEGLVTSFNKACISLAGRPPVANRDRWCVTWKLFTESGEPLPHDRSPMAVADKERRPVRGVAVVAERPEGGRVCLMPYPTPLFDAAGTMTGAVNLLEDITARRVEELRDQIRRCRRLARDVGRDPIAARFEELAVEFDDMIRRLTES